MKLVAYSLLLVIASSTISFATPNYDTNSVIVTRLLEKQLFEANSVPFMQPLVTTLNSASNSRFFNQAYVPTKVDKPYFRFSINSMVGFVRDDQREYTPTLPVENRSVVEFAPQYMDIDLLHNKFSIRDTAGLMLAVTERLFKKGLDKGFVTLPSKAATFFGNKQGRLDFLPDSLAGLLSSDPEFSFVYNQLDSTSKARLRNTVLKLPGALALPQGQNMNTVFAAVPQLEVGSLYGTELLLRYIPPVKWDTSVGAFSFFGIALKHSISQYFNDPSFHLAMQVGYQTTNLSNTVGVTEAKLTASATFFDVNIHASKSIKDWFDVYTGLDYASVKINSEYRYRLPQEVQISLGLLRVDTDTLTNKKTVVKAASAGYPGDDVIQQSDSEFKDATVKWTLGIYRKIGPFAICLDYAVSKFNVFGAGLEFRF